MEGVGWVGLVRARWVDGEEHLRICNDGHRVHDGKTKRHPSRLAARVTQMAFDGCAGGLERAWRLPQQVQSVFVWVTIKHAPCARERGSLPQKEWSGASRIGISV